MARIDARLTELEKRMAPAPELRIYGESLRVPGGLFVRTMPPDPAGRHMTRAECVADAGDATTLFVTYAKDDTDER